MPEIFVALPAPPLWGTLIRSKSDPCLFHSFGPWEDDDDVVAMRRRPGAVAAFHAIKLLREEMTPGDYELVIHVAVREDADRGSRA
jgi:hypothetical protein